MQTYKRVSKSFSSTGVLEKVTTKCSTKLNNIQERFIHVSVVGAAGAVGSPLCMLLKQMPLISKITFFDKAPSTLGVAKDCSHIQSKAKVKAFKKSKNLGKAVRGADIIVLCQCCCGLNQPSTNKELFERNSATMVKIANCIANISPSAILLVVTNPVNSMVPLISEVFKERCVYNPRKIIGMTVVNTVRANRFVAAALKCNPLVVNVPVLGGQSCDTTVPIFSRARPKTKKLPKKKIEKLTTKVKESGITMQKLRSCESGSSRYSLAMSYAAARFINSLCLAKSGQNDVIEPCYVRSNVCKGIKYFSSPCKLGPKGVKKICEIPDMNVDERCQLDTAIQILKKDIELGTCFIKNKTDKQKTNV